MYSAIAKNKRNTILIIVLFLVIIAALSLIPTLIYNDPTYSIVIVVISFLM